MKLVLQVAAIAALSIGCSAESSSAGPQLGERASAVDYDNWTYFQVVLQDFRRCMPPLCGGVYVARVNQSQTKCADGTWQKSCYVADFDFAALGLTAAQLADATNFARARALVVRGRMATGYYAAYPGVPVLAVDEGWLSDTGLEPSGVLSRVKTNSVACTGPGCANIEATELNRNFNPVRYYSALDLSQAGAAQAQIDLAVAELGGNGVLVAAKTPKGKDTLVANQFFMKFP